MAFLFQLSINISALGLGTLKEQANHFKEYVTKEKQQEISPELQRRFDHGHECEVHVNQIFI